MDSMVSPKHDLDPSLLIWSSFIVLTMLPSAWLGVLLSFTWFISLTPSSHPTILWCLFQNCVPCSHCPDPGSIFLCQKIVTRRAAKPSPSISTPSLPLEPFPWIFQHFLLPVAFFSPCMLTLTPSSAFLVISDWGYLLKIYNPAIDESIWTKFIPLPSNLTCNQVLVCRSNWPSPFVMCLRFALDVSLSPDLGSHC